MRDSLDEIMIRFFRDDISGILVTKAGEVIYDDAKSRFIQRENTNWRTACPPPREGQKAEYWDLLNKDSGKTYMVATSTFPYENEMIQVHQLVNSSMYMEMYRDITTYSRTLKNEKDHDSLTGLYNKGKFTELQHSLFVGQDAIAVYNMDVNDLKHMNDTYGHEAGDRLILKAAESIRRIEARNVLGFRVGGDEFIVVGLHLSPEDAENLLHAWEAGLSELNRKNDGVPCSIACGFAYGEKGYNLDDVFTLADHRMYENKKAMKLAAHSASPGKMQIPHHPASCKIK